MSQISGAPLAVSPGQLGQILLRSGVLPENLMRPGQNIQMLVLQDAKAGEKTQIQIAGRNLEAVLPGPVGAGQQIQVRVTRAASDGVQLRLVDIRPGPPTLKVPQDQQAQIQSLAARSGGQVQVQVAPGGKELMISGQPFTLAQLGLPQVPPMPRWAAAIRLSPGETMQLVAVFPERAQQLRSLAGDLVLSRQAKLIETGVELSQHTKESQQTYSAGGSLLIGPAWMQLPDGTPISISHRPQLDEPSQSWSAQFSLHGAALGEVGIRLVTSAAGTQIYVQTDPEHAELLKSTAAQLQERVRIITGQPVQVQIRDNPSTPTRPPEGYQYYG